LAGLEAVGLVLGLELGCSLVAVVEVAVAAEPPQDARAGSPDDALHLFGGRLGKRDEVHSVLVEDEHAVGGDDVKMDVEVQRATEALHERHRRGLGVR
jgi:hypothetical protein